MKRLNHVFILLLFVGAITGCKTKVIQTTTYTANDPVYMTYEELRTSITNDAARQLENPGKIYLYNDYVLINEFEKGIHVYDNTSPSSPQHITFINIPGNVDMAIKDGILYADSYVDLVAIDFSDPTAAKEVGRVKDVLSYTIPAGFDMDYPVANIDKAKGVIVGYEVKKVTETCESSNCGTYYMFNEDVNLGGATDQAQPQTGFAGGAESNVRNMVVPQSGTGIAGSMARFMMLKDHLYLIADGTTVKIFDITNPTSPTEVGKFNPNDNNTWIGEIETLFTFNGYMFIGSSNGMGIYNVKNEANPAFEGNYVHFTSCDPVVANEQYAFVTLRTGTNCGGWINQMDVLDIADVKNPSQITSVSMTNPHGLGLDNSMNLVFVCDGDAGLKVYNFEDPNNLRLLNEVSMNATDVIPHNNMLHVIGDKGLEMYQYQPDGQLSWIGQVAL